MNRGIYAIIVIGESLSGEKNLVLILEIIRICGKNVIGENKKMHYVVTRRLVEVDVQNLARQILTWPLQLSVQVNNEKYLLAHAMTSKPECAENKYYYLIGNEMNAEYLCNGVEGYTSICGHRNTVNHKIWKNEKGNLIMCDCGCGFIDGKLGCLCLETKEEFYV